MRYLTQSKKCVVHQFACECACVCLRACRCMSMSMHRVCICNPFFLNISADCALCSGISVPFIFCILFVLRKGCVTATLTKCSTLCFSLAATVTQIVCPHNTSSCSGWMVYTHFKSTQTMCLIGACWCMRSALYVCIENPRTGQKPNNSFLHEKCNYSHVTSSNWTQLASN
jgi:hypothetical protein